MDMPPTDLPEDSRAREGGSDEYTGCLTCIHGRFVPGNHPQQVRCDVFGTITERETCDKFDGPETIQHQVFSDPTLTPILDVLLKASKRAKRRGA